MGKAHTTKGPSPDYRGLFRRWREAGRVTVTIPELVQALGLTEPTIRDLYRTGRVPVVQIGRRKLFALDDLERYLVEQGGAA